MVYNGIKSITADLTAKTKKEVIMQKTQESSVLQCVNLTKRYGRNDPPVLSKLNLSLPHGKVIGLLGPNGCGKSTLIKLVAGLLTPDMGRIRIDGRPISPRTNAMISYLPERTYFDPSMSVLQLVKFFADFYSDFDQGSAKRMLRDLKIPLTSKLRTLSKGTKEKVQLILVMSRRAKLYLLDEPIAGVDPATRDYIMNTIISNRPANSTVLITTHLIHDIEGALDEFMFMNYSGEILLSGNAEATRKEHGKTLDQLFREVFRC